MSESNQSFVNSSFQAGTVRTLTVAREKSPFGFFLTDGRSDVLLHYTQKVGEIEIGAQIEVFLYHDSHDRLAATMHKPLITLGQIGRVKVADIHTRLGCFVDIGLDRHVLVPRSELPELSDFMPQIGDILFVLLTHDKQGRLLAKPAKERDLAPLVSAMPASWKNKWLQGVVYNPLQMGTFVLIEDELFPFAAIGMIHSSVRVRPLRMGEPVEVRVSFVREDGRANLSMRAVKQEAMDQDSQKILAVLQQRNGAMPYSDESPADIIMSKFQMSKSAFKRALGRLMKSGRIRQDRSWTYLKAEDEE